jgi:hypothetical protein
LLLYVIPCLIPLVVTTQSTCVATGQSADARSADSKVRVESFSIDFLQQMGTGQAKLGTRVRLHGLTGNRFLYNFSAVRTSIYNDYHVFTP